MGELTPLSIDDYDAIAAAVEETGRGRWFLSEFARRNRTADTRTVLEALSGLERRLETREPVSTKAVGLVEEALRSVRAAQAVGGGEKTTCLADAEYALISALQALGGDFSPIRDEQAKPAQTHVVEIAATEAVPKATLALAAPDPQDEAAWVDLDVLEDQLMEADDEILTPRERAVAHVNGAAAAFDMPDGDESAVADDALESPRFVTVDAPQMTINGHASSASDVSIRPKLPVAHTPRLLESLSEAEKAILFA